MEPGQLLREARRRSRLSQYEVATRAGCSQSVVARVESGERDPSLAKLERMLAACGFQLHTELEPLDTALDEQIQTLAAAGVRSSLAVLSRALLYMAPLLSAAEIPFAVDGVAAAILYGFPLPYEGVQLRIRNEPHVLKGFARQLRPRRDADPASSIWDKDVAALPRLKYIYDLCDPDIHWIVDYTPLRVRTQRTDPCDGAVTITVRDYDEIATVSVVPVQRLILPRTHARALERSRHRFEDLQSAERRTSRVQA
jgi:transcriptional regulator with XRE-family HTH domain